MTIKKEKLSIKKFLSFDKLDETATIRFLPYEEPSYFNYFDKAWGDKAMEVSKECPICEYEADVNFDILRAYGRAYGIENKTIIAKAPKFKVVNDDFIFMDYMNIMGEPWREKKMAAITETGREVLNEILLKLNTNGFVSKDTLLSSMGYMTKILDEMQQEDLFSAPEMQPMTVEQELVDARHNYYKDNQGLAGNSCYGLFQESISPKKNSYVGEDPLESMLLPPTPVAIEAWRKLVGR